MKRKLAIAAAFAAVTLAVGGTAYATSQDSGTPATMVDSEQKLGNGQEADVDVVEGDEASTTTTTMVDSEKELGNGQEADIEYETPATMVDSEDELGNGQEADIEYETPAAG